MKEAVAPIIRRILGQPEQAADVPPVKQGIRCNGAFSKRRGELLSTLQPAEVRTVIEGGSALGRKWLSAIPFNIATRLSDSEVSVALHYRTLCSGEAPNCAHCAKPNFSGHDEVCESRSNWRLARHEMVKKLLMRHIGTAKGTKVKAEPAIPGSHLRTDFRVTGAASVCGAASEFDLTIVSLHSGDSDAAFKRAARYANDDTTASQLGDLQVEGAMESAWEEKDRKYSDITATPFQPLVMTTGGAVSKATMKCFDHWRPLVRSWSFMTMCISMTLVRSRAKHFTF